MVSYKVIQTCSLVLLSLLAASLTTCGNASDELRRRFPEVFKREDKETRRVSEGTNAAYLHNPRPASLASRWRFRKSSWYFTFGGTVITIA